MTLDTLTGPLAIGLLSTLTVSAGCKAVPEVATPPEIQPSVAQASIGDSDGIVKGRILDESGAPLAGAAVLLFGDLTSEERRAYEATFWTANCTKGFDEALAERFQLVASTVSGPDGSYRFTGLAEGAYTLRVSAQGFGVRELGLRVGPAIQ